MRGGDKIYIVYALLLQTNKFIRKLGWRIYSSDLSARTADLLVLTVNATKAAAGKENRSRTLYLIFNALPGKTGLFPVVRRDPSDLHIGA